ncbi:MAG: 5-oxoprolinase subunit PxpB [Chitinophagaceae bacterium]|nr:5-oxoprolinase subunit PxpB [Chitinophagaceae bacterium]
MNPLYQIHPLSETAVTIEFGKEISPLIHQQVMQADKLLKSAAFQWWIENVPAYTTLTVFYNPAEVKHSNDLHGATAGNKVIEIIKQALQFSGVTETENRNEIIVPVCYDEEFAYDIGYVASCHHISADEVIQLHTQTGYTVYMMGFTPGFPYMGVLPEQLDTPRKTTPRAEVAAGSVGIAGKQTGIYPFATPGGWQIIGRTPLKLFDVKREGPAIFQPGDKVKFEAITKETFYQLQQA